MQFIDQEQIHAFVNGVCASVAVLERNHDDFDKVVVCNDYFREMFGGGSKLTETTPFVLTDLIPRYNRQEFLNNIDRCFDERTPLEFEQAIDRKNKTCWCRISLKPVVNGEHDVDHLLITCQDITRRVVLEHELKLESSRFSSVIEAAYDGIISINQREKIVLFNKTAQELFGYTDEEIMGQSIEGLIPEQFRKNHGVYVEKFAASPIQSRQMEERSRVYGVHKSGREFPIEISISKINVGSNVEYTAIVRDISDKIRLLDHLTNQATKDYLTGIFNRREFEEQAAALFSTARSNGQPLSILMLDVDNFKTINDRFGHASGDEVLQLISKVVSTTIQHLDLFARLGGEEFVVLMPNTNQIQAMAMAERLRKIFDTQSFQYNWQGEAIPFTFSIGVATLEDSDQSTQTMLKRADKALYRAKEGGRNAVKFSPSLSNKGELTSDQIQ